jgi:hypothetical protein
MIKKICNIDEFDVSVTPSHKDLFLKTLTNTEVFHLNLPTKFLMGENWTAETICKNCNNKFEFGRFSSNFKRLNYLSNYYIYNTDYLDYLSSPFSHLVHKDYQSISRRVYSYYFNNEALVKVFITFCPNCNASYLGSFAERYGGEIERSPADLSPDYVYIDELVLVDIDREKFMEEFKRNQGK